MNGVQTRLKCKPNVKQCKRLVFPARSALFNHNILNTKAISHFQDNHILIRFVFPPLLAILDVSYPDDYNTAVCLMSLGYDKRALEIMTEQADTSDRNYLLAILYSRLKREEDALKMYVKSCDQDASKIWRGKLDPEINKLIVTYNLYKDELY